MTGDHQYECTSHPNDGLRIVHVARKATYGIIPGVIWCWSHGTWEPIPQEWLAKEGRLRKKVVMEWLTIRAGDLSVFRSDCLVELISQYVRFRFWRPVDMDNRYDMYRFMDDLTKYAPAEEEKTMGDHGQIEVYSNGSTHTLYEFCGFDACREAILERGFEIESDVFAKDEFVITGTDRVTVTITVRNSLDESDSCVWCFGCGDFLRHANAGTPCECENPDEDRESLRPLVMDEPPKMELRPWSAHSGMRND